MSGPVVTITRISFLRWEWEAWHRGASGGGPVARGRSLTRKRANAAALAPVKWAQVVVR